MSKSAIATAQSIFSSRLDTLEQLLKKASTHFGSNESFLAERIAPDMHPLGTQIAFTCNQPRNFSLWCGGMPNDNLDPGVTSVAHAQSHISSTKQLLHAINTNDSKRSETARIELGGGLYIELRGEEYINDFLIPNFYFHMVTAYDILRMKGLEIGKGDYMLHLAPLVRQAQ